MPVLMSGLYDPGSSLPSSWVRGNFLGIARPRAGGRVVERPILRLVESAVPTLAPAGGQANETAAEADHVSAGKAMPIDLGEEPVSDL
jgi:hypothetical protein